MFVSSAVGACLTSSQPGRDVSGASTDNRENEKVRHQDKWLANGVCCVLGPRTLRLATQGISDPVP